MHYDGLYWRMKFFIKELPKFVKHSAAKNDLGKSTASQAVNVKATHTSLMLYSDGQHSHLSATCSNTEQHFTFENCNGS